MQKLLVLGLLSLAACAGGESACELAASRIQACTGATPELSQCDEAAAEIVLEQSCEELAAGSGKADGFWCTAFGVFCDPPELPELRGQPVRFPIILTHGFNGSPENEWGFHPRLITALREDGHQVFVARVSPFASVADRAQELGDQVDAALHQFGADKVNIIAHSMGGLDSRHLVSRLGYANKVASISTISSPHRGTLIADAVLGLTPEFSEDAINFLAEALARRFTSDELAEDSDLFAAMRDLTESGANERNAATPNMPGVYYQSWAGVSNVAGIPNPKDREACEADGGAWLVTAARDVMEPRLVPMAALVAHGTALLPNDGMATVASARWGNFRGCIPADHYDEIAQIEDLAPNPRSDFAPAHFYRSMAFELAEMGF